MHISLRHQTRLLKVSKYVRYVDDFAMFSDDQIFLADVIIAIEEYLASLRLKIHSIKSQLFETKHGANFLGFRIFLDRIRVRTENLRRARRSFPSYSIINAIADSP